MTMAMKEFSVHFSVFARIFIHPRIAPLFRTMSALVQFVTAAKLIIFIQEVC
jgi:hypothetical protein